MPRKEKLPPNVTSFVDRHGKRRFRYRGKGRAFYLHEQPNTAAGKAEIAMKLAGQDNPAPRYPIGTVGWLAGRYIASAAFLGRKGAHRQHTSRLILDKFVAEYATYRIADFRFDHIETILLKTAQVWTDGKGRKRGGPHAAVNLRDQLKPFFAYAYKLLRLTGKNPIDEAAPLAAPSKGFHSWTEGEIATFRAHHAVGTKARLALEIILWTAQRRGDAAKFGPEHLRDGRVHFVAGKNGASIWLPAAPQLLAAIGAMPVVGTKTFLVTDYGKPFSVAGFGNKFREWCDEAGLPHCSAHGVRKALARRAAEQGASNQRLKALGGWKRDEEVAIYTAAAEQATMAAAALAPVIEFDLATRDGTK